MFSLIIYVITKLRTSEQNVGAQLYYTCFLNRQIKELDEKYEIGFNYRLYMRHQQ